MEYRLWIYAPWRLLQPGEPMSLLGSLSLGEGWIEPRKVSIPGRDLGDCLWSLKGFEISVYLICCAIKIYNTKYSTYNIKSTAVYVGIGTPPSPSLASECALPPRTGGAGAHSPAGEGLGESQFRRLEKKLSTLPALWSIISYVQSVCIYFQVQCTCYTTFVSHEPCAAAI